jgi:hypothetical protein
MEPNHARTLVVFEVAADGITDVGVELLEVVRLGEDRLARRACV